MSNGLWKCRVCDEVVEQNREHKCERRVEIVHSQKAVDRLPKMWDVYRRESDKSKWVVITAVHESRSYKLLCIDVGEAPDTLLFGDRWAGLSLYGSYDVPLETRLGTVTTIVIG